MEQRLQQIPLLQAAMSQNISSEDEPEDPVLKRKTRTLKSGRDLRGPCPLRKESPGPDEVIYGADGHPATYQDLTVSSFVKCYLIVLKDVQVSEVKDSIVLH